MEHPLEPGDWFMRASFEHQLFTKFLVEDNGGHRVFATSRSRGLRIGQ
jgi:hypothetical protein